MEQLYNNLLSQNIFSDKNTSHSYLPTYEQLFRSKIETAENVLEVGIGDFYEKNGGSILLWSQYFKNANIIGVDVLPIQRCYDELLNHPRIKLYTKSNAYSEKFVHENINMKLDIAIDDGPHTLSTMIDFVQLYSPLLKEDGILVIEDIQKYEWIDHLRLATPEELKKYVKVYDLRMNKDRYDDILFVIDKSEFNTREV